MSPSSMPRNPSASSFPHVETPITLNQVRLKNRIVVPAHTTNFGERHLPSARHAEYHRQRARGGAGAIIFELVRVSDNALGRPQGVAIRPNVAHNPFEALLDGWGLTFALVGDCLAPRTALEAVFEGHAKARGIGKHS